MADAAQLITEVHDRIEQEESAEVTTRKFLSFTVDQEIYALSVLDIKEIIEYAQVTRIPMAPNYIRGVTNLRGNVVPVIDLAARLGMKSTPLTSRTCIVIVEVFVEEERIDLGVVIDAINEVFNVTEDEIEPAPSFGAGIRVDFIWGMGKRNGKFVTLLNKDKVLSIDELSLLSEHTVSIQEAASLRSNEELANQSGESS